VVKNPSVLNQVSNVRDLRVTNNVDPERPKSSPMVIKEATDYIFEQSMEAVEEYLR